jgi:hypothetical protein
MFVFVLQHMESRVNGVTSRSREDVLITLLLVNDRLLRLATAAALILGSISSTFYVQLLRTYVASVAFLCLRFRFVLYWHKPTGAKAACKCW